MRFLGFVPGPDLPALYRLADDLLCSDPHLQAQMSAASLRIISGHERHRALTEWESLYSMLRRPGSGDL